MGREYPWDPKMNAFGRWVTNVGGGKYFIRFEEVVDRAKNKNKPTDEAFAVLIGSRPNVNKRKELLENMRYHEFFVRKELQALGRVIIPDGGADGSVYDEPSLPLRCKRYAGKTVALYQTLKKTNVKVLVKKRIYDNNGDVLQDFDFFHGKGFHIFPHIHVWFKLGPNCWFHSKPLRYRAKETKR